MTALWDSGTGGFHRYADAADWSEPGTEKTLDDNAALLHVYVEAALRLRDAEWLRAGGGDRPVGERTRWPMRRTAVSSTPRHPRTVDKTMYVDRNAMMVGAFIRAAALFDDIWLRDFALKSLEAVIVPAYKPGEGVAHLAGADGAGQRAWAADGSNPCRVGAYLGACGDRTVAVLDAGRRGASVRDPHDVGRRGGRLPRSRWLRRTRSCRSSSTAMPRACSIGSACSRVMRRIRTAPARFCSRSRQSISEHDLFGAPYALAVREVFDRRPPAGLELSPVDWQLG